MKLFHEVVVKMPPLCSYRIITHVVISSIRTKVDVVVELTRQTKH